MTQQPTPLAAGTVQPAFPPPPELPPLPNEYVLLATLLILVTLLPISVALARRLWRGTKDSVSRNDSRLDDRLADMQGSIDSIALEVERIGEGQRFVTGLLHAGSRAASMDSLKELPEAVQKQDFRAITPH